MIHIYFSAFHSKPVKSLAMLTATMLHCLKSRYTLVLIILFLLLPIFAHPFYFEPNFTPGANNVLYEGDAAPSDGAINLTPDTERIYRIGRASCAEPVHLWDSSTGMVADFTSRFSFTLNKLSATGFADGIAFFLTPVGYEIPPNSNSAYFGLFNSSSIQRQVVIVEFDSFANQWDPPMSHVGINNGFISSAVYAGWNVSSINGELANALIAYNATTKNLTVSLTYGDDPDLIGNSTSYTMDLTQVLPEWVRIGFAAATGLTPQLHTINSWEFSSTLESKLPRRAKNKWGTIAIIKVGCPLGLSVSMLLGFAYFVVKRRRAMAKSKSAANIHSDASMNADLERKTFPKRFTYQELASATNNFADHMRLGQGGSGQVYKGMLNDLGRVVAVKRIFTEPAHSRKIFSNEVKIISRLIHRNLVQFIGWCDEEGSFLLVYEYMPNGSLDSHLYGNRKGLPWHVRYRIALGLASAIHYLHEDAEKCVLHRDIKSANVLLDNDFNTKLGDFGVAKLVDSRLRTQTTALVGTYGYMAPEYATEGRASKKSDMFSFGIVALEIACGRKYFYDGETHVALPKWVWPLYLGGNILNAADERLSGDFDTEEVKCLLMVGLWCAHPRSKERPKAGQVISYLRLETPVPQLPSDAHDLVLPAPPPSLPPPSHVDSAAASFSSSLHFGR